MKFLMGHKVTYSHFFYQPDLGVHYEKINLGLPNIGNSANPYEDKSHQANDHRQGPMLQASYQWVDFSVPK